MDVEVSASGFTQQMQKDLNVEMGLEEDVEEEKENDQGKESTITEEDVEELRKQVESLVSQGYRNDAENNDKEETSQSKSDVCHEELVLHENAQTKVSDICTSSSTQKKNEKRTEMVISEGEEGITSKMNSPDVYENERDIRFSEMALSEDEEETNVEESSPGVNKSEQIYNYCKGVSTASDRMEILSRLYDDALSMRSTSTAATIAPDVIKSRVKKTLERREQAARKRIVIKGEANAVTRSRRENQDTIKQCSGIWGWE